jgi:hypothetical protein
MKTINKNVFVHKTRHSLCKMGQNGDPEAAQKNMGHGKDKWQRVVFSTLNKPVAAHPG